MPLHQNNQILVDHLQSLPLLDGRFENIQLVNFDSVTDAKRGCFSLVFSAYDVLSKKQVALKFFDLQWMLDRYRLEAFGREHQILETLVTVDRCLQLASDLSVYSLSVDIGNGKSVTLPCKYFAVDWLDQEIDSFFLNANGIDALDKLHLFNEIVLAIEVLHKHEIFHRDIKADNLRAYKDALKRIVVAIDLGTAAKYDSGPISAVYGNSVGAPAYAAPEACVGLAGNRILAPYTDTYALGCLLYELFNMDYMYVALRSKNASYDLVVTGMGRGVHGGSDIEKAKSWCAALDKLSLGIAPLKIANTGTTVPLGIASILDEVLGALTHVDYRKRPSSLAWVRSKIWSAIKVLQNEKAYQKKLKRSRDLRELRRKNALEKDAKLALRCKQKGQLC